MMNFLKKFKLLLTIFALSLLQISCNTASTAIKKIDSDQDINNAPFSTEDQKINEDKIIEVEEAEIDLDYPVDWEPRITSTPAKQPHERFYLPNSNVQKIKTYFYNNVDINKVKGKNLEEDDYELHGYIEYFDGSIVDYTFDKDEGNYLGEKIYLAGNYQMSKNFSDFHRDIIYKMLDVSGVENPKFFFKELLNSPKITKYEGCTVQQKQAKYSMIDVTSCSSDDRTDITLYNPDFE